MDHVWSYVLRLDECTPAFSSLKFAITNNHKQRRGRHQSNLFNLLTNDLASRNLNLKSIDDLYKLRELAMKRLEWHALAAV